MINFNIRFKNPFSDTWKILFFKSGLLGKNHAWEFNVYRTSTIVSVDLNVTTRCDHAGLQTMFGLFGYDFEFHFYDTRHFEG